MLNFCQCKYGNSQTFDLAEKGSFGSNNEPCKSQNGTFQGLDFLSLPCEPFYVLVNFSSPKKCCARAEPELFRFPSVSGPNFFCSG